MPARIPAEVLQKILQLEPYVKQLDLVELMALEVLDNADFFVSECFYENEEVLKKWIYIDANEVFESARRLFSKFYDYEMPEWITANFNRRVEEIVKLAVERYKQKCTQLLAVANQ
jgi:hypothetical protein